MTSVKTNSISICLRSCAWTGLGVSSVHAALIQRQLTLSGLTIAYAAAKTALSNVQQGPEGDPRGTRDHLAGGEKCGHGIDWSSRSGSRQRRTDGRAATHGLTEWHPDWAPAQARPPACSAPCPRHIPITFSSVAVFAQDRRQGQLAAKLRMNAARGAQKSPSKEQ
jgi:hypothetical protein